MKRLLMATALMLATTATWAQAPAEQDAHHPAQTVTPAQPAPPSAAQGMVSGMPMMHMRMMRMMGTMTPGSGMSTIDHIEGRIAFLRAELKITDAQMSAWNAFADALRANAKKLGEVRAAMMSRSGSGQQPLTLADRLDLQEQWLVARLEGIRVIKPAFVNLFGTLSDEQKKTANELLAPHMGMMAMMSGMQSGQMGGPGQMTPGQMQPGQMMPQRSMPR
jgi:hypothetical protein